VGGKIQREVYGGGGPLGMPRNPKIDLEKKKERKAFADYQKTKKKKKKVLSKEGDGCLQTRKG